jgi:signal transduction histidine kinase
MTTRLVLLFALLLGASLLAFGRLSERASERVLASLGEAAQATARAAVRMAFVGDTGAATVLPVGAGATWTEAAAPWEGIAVQPAPGRDLDLRMPAGSARVPLADYQRAWREARAETVWMLVGVAFAGAVAGAALIRWSLRPLRALDAGIARVGEGDLGALVPASGPPEIARLGRAFHRMTARLAEARGVAKLTALGRLAAGVAHDVRNPLHAIGLTLGRLEAKARPSEPERAAAFDRAVATARHELHRLDRTVTRYLEMAARAPDARAPLVLATALRQVVDLLAPDAERRGVRLTLDVDPATPPVLAATESLHGALLNLLLNALEATPRGGSVAVRAHGARDEAVIEVRDTGPGVAADVAARAFEFGFSTKANGHGLGLAMVRHVIEDEHGGRVELTGEASGTCARVHLPAGGTDA